MRLASIGKWFGVLCMISVLLSGCMYPKDRLPQNQLSPMEQVGLVQKGIDEFHKEKEILPILTKEADTPIYEKYVIDFRQMVPKYIPYVPGAAFEQGGPYLFVLTDVETNPTVKLLDLRLTDKVGAIQSKVSDYFNKKSSLPVGGVVKPGFFTINPKEIGVSNDGLKVESPFTGNELPLIMSSTGSVGIDYSKDISVVLTNNKIHPSAGMDVRGVLPENSIYVPVKSFPYTLHNGKPMLRTSEK